MVQLSSAGSTKLGKRQGNLERRWGLGLVRRSLSERSSILSTTQYVLLATRIGNEIRPPERPAEASVNARTACLSDDYNHCNFRKREAQRARHNPQSSGCGFTRRDASCLFFRLRWTLLCSDGRTSAPVCLACLLLLIHHMCLH
jgi:hypothetical protein